MSLNLICMPTSETITSLITPGLQQLWSVTEPSITSLQMYVCVYELAATSVTSAGARIRLMWLLSSPGLRSVGAKPTLSPNRTVSAVEAKEGEWACVSTQPHISQIHLWLCVFIFVLEASLGPPIHTQSLINVKSLHMGCQKAVGGAADEAAPTLVALLGDVLSLSVTHTHTPQCM